MLSNIYSDMNVIKNAIATH